MNLLQTFQKRHVKKKIPPIHVGDVVRVHEKIREGKKERIQVFEGIIIAIHAGKSLNATFTVRKTSFGIGVEKVFPLHLPAITKIETIKNIKVRRAKLYYLRNLTDKQLRRKQELSKYTVWKDEKTEAEEEELKKRKEGEAKAKADLKKKEQGMLDKKFEQAQASKQASEEATKELKNEKTEEQKQEESK